MARTFIEKFDFFSPYDHHDVDVDEVDDDDDGSFFGGEFRVPACADMGSEDHPWCAPIFLSFFYALLLFSQKGLS
jgi:hypothetical protein